MSHTPGPWIFDPKPWNIIDDPHLVVSTSDIRTVGLKAVIAMVAPWQNQEANAHLIAAAPELLEALQGWMNVYRLLNEGEAWADCVDLLGMSSGDVYDFLEASRAALAKATGQPVQP